MLMRPIKINRSRFGKIFRKRQWRYIVQNKGILTDREIRIIQSFIKDNYQEMYKVWATMGENGFYGEN